MNQTNEPKIVSSRISTADITGRFQIRANSAEQAINAAKLQILNTYGGQFIYDDEVVCLGKDTHPAFKGCFDIFYKVTKSIKDYVDSPLKENASGPCDACKGTGYV